MKNEILFIILLLIAIAILISITTFYKGVVEQKDAIRFVTEDLTQKNPDAKIEILSVENRTNEYGAAYYAIKAAVTTGMDTPCPVRTHFNYNYPEQNFVPDPPEYITRNCRIVCEGRYRCVIAFPEEAIIASHTFPGTEDVNDFIMSYAAKPTVQKEESSWTVLWKSPSVNYSYAVVITMSGRLGSVNVTSD